MSQKPENHPFAPDTESQIRAWGELRLIEHIQAWLKGISPPPPKGIGDDCAVVDTSADCTTIMTVDSLTYGQHFDDSVSPESAGSKLVKRNLSDIAAMGGMPRTAVLALLCGPDLSQQWLEKFFTGVRKSCIQYGVKIIGGDVSSLNEGQFSSVLTLTGDCPHPVCRALSNEGDSIFVTGTLGGSLSGKHYAFEPRLKEGIWLSTSGECTSMMDLTDGLAKDLPTLLSEGMSAEIDLPSIPVSAEAIETAQNCGKNPLELAFTDGEDYELLFTTKADCNPSDFIAKWSERFPSVSLSRIGTVARKCNEARLIDQSTKKALPWTHGFEHLRRS
ncbi:MAG: thiamine-phosphate kinase [Coraliomargarita sp.]